MQGVICFKLDCMHLYKFEQGSHPPLVPVRNHPANLRHHSIIVVHCTYPLCRSYAHSKLKRLWSDFSKLPKDNQLLLPRFPTHMKECIKAVEINSKFLKAIVENAVGVFQNSDISQFVS